MDAVAAMVTWLACLPPNSGLGALDPIPGAGWGSAPTAEMVFYRQEGALLWYGLPTKRSSLRIACFVADRVEFGYQDGRLSAVSWQFDGRDKGLVEGGLWRVEPDPSNRGIAIEVDGVGQHSWVVVIPKEAP